MTPAKKRSPTRQLGAQVAARVGGWGAAATQHGGGPVRSEAVGILAQLRRASLADLGSNPAVWGAVIETVPEELQGHGDDPSKAEVAAFAAMAMYAVHQQARPDVVHRKGRPFGQAVGSLARNSSHGGAAMTRRFGALVTSQGAEELLTHLRSLTALIRNAKSPDGRPLNLTVDYDRLARDLYLLQEPRWAPGVRLRWGRDFAHQPKDTDAATGDGASPVPSETLNH